MPRMCLLAATAFVAAFLFALSPSRAVAQAGAVAPEPETITVAVDRTLRPTDRKLLGINLNYLLDNDANRPPGARPLARAVADLGVGSLRYPGGAKSDVTLWAASPYRKPHPTLALLGPEEWPASDRRVYNLATHQYANKTLDFDAFIRLCRQTGAEPVVVIPHDAMYRPARDGSVIPDMATLLQNAVSLVRYANIERGYGVKYFEIGNESYFYVYDGGSRAKDYARDLKLFAAAMKGVDPSIRIGANGPVGETDVGALDNMQGDHTIWWQAVFAEAGPSIDFVSVHEYPCYAWYGYDAYRAQSAPMLGVSEIDKAARDYGPPGLAKRLRYLLTEVNSADWYGHPQNLGWKHENTLGHALVLLDMLEQAVSDPRVVTAQIWATRWLNNAKNPELWDALDAHNKPLPTGAALKILAEHLGSRIVATTDAPEIRAFATRDDRKQELDLLLINKSSARSAAVRLLGGQSGNIASRVVWDGSGPDDKEPRLHAASPVPVFGDRMTIALPAVSLTIVRVPLSSDKDVGLHFANLRRPGKETGRVTDREQEKGKRKIGLCPNPPGA
ncbi:MAG: alpha-L-arabinofuranosidase [Acidobacteriota bacterium]